MTNKIYTKKRREEQQQKMWVEWMWSKEKDREIKRGEIHEKENWDSELIGGSVYRITHERDETIDRSIDTKKK